jgi:hypothetical protein
MKQAIFVVAVLAMALLADRAKAGPDEELAAAIVLHAIDWRQTVWISKHPESFRELNPLLPKFPSQGQVNRYFALTGAAMVAAHYLLPPEYAKWSTRVWIGLQVGAISKNLAVGVKMDF